MASLKPGISALQLQAQLGISRYETAWVLLHKLRRAMVDPDRSQLAGTVEVDETWIGGKQAGIKGSRQRKGRKALMVVLAVERRERSLGRLRLEVVTDDTAATLGAFIVRNIKSGSTVVSDAWSGYTGLAAKDYIHLSLSQSAMKRAGLEGDAVPGIHRVVSNMKTWLMGTHHGVGAGHLDHYLNEFVFRFNRRYHPMAGFATLLGLSTSQSPTTADAIRSPLSGAPVKRRRGRSTGLTATRGLRLK
jgi:transposase-like protein